MKLPGVAWVALPQRKSCHVQVRTVERGRARQDTVVIVREALRLHQGVLAAGRAAGKIGSLRSLSVKRVGDLLAPHGHQVNRAEAEILDPFGMPEQACRRRRRIAERNRQGIAHVAGRTAVERAASRAPGSEIAVGRGKAGLDAAGE
jgi:hypothetical protein